MFTFMNMRIFFIQINMPFHTKMACLSVWRCTSFIEDAHLYTDKHPVLHQKIRLWPIFIPLIIFGWSIPTVHMQIQFSAAFTKIIFSEYVSLFEYIYLRWSVAWKGVGDRSKIFLSKTGRPVFLVKSSLSFFVIK